MASSKYCTRLFLKAEPPAAKENLLAMVCRRMAGVLFGNRLLLQEEHAHFFVEVAHLLDEVLRGLFRYRFLIGGNVGNLMRRAKLIMSKGWPFDSAHQSDL